MHYHIGIDLGTTHCCVAYVDMVDPRGLVHSFKIPQLTAEGSIDSLSMLPSFCYLTSPYEWPEGSLKLPWTTPKSYFVGQFAQRHGAKVPTRLVQSAKSWLCHAGSNRRDNILPLESADEEFKISPVQASSRYLAHIRDAWNQSIAKGVVDAEFEHQDIILTVPASFDEIARTLTIEAAREAGLVNITLLEEPQAAFYSWIAQNPKHNLPIGSSILVCDVGGGTTDFSMIEVVSKEGQVSFQRMSVGDHLLLGGDNMDAAIAHFIENRLNASGTELTTTQRLQLTHEARSAKETLLSSMDDNEIYRLIIQGSGSGVIQNTIVQEISRLDLKRLLNEGFLQQYPWLEALQLRRNIGMRTMGLPYEAESSITKHLAHFLSMSKSTEQESAKPDFILFNGGVMKSSLFRDSILTSLKNWFPEKTLAELPSYNLDLALARGAAYYGKSRRGLGVKIGGGIARSYYLVLDVKDSHGKIEQKALTLLPRGSDEGSMYEPETIFSLTPNTPVSFQLCTSHVRLQDTQGELVDIDPNEMNLLPPIQTVLRYGKQHVGDINQEKIPVQIQISLTPIGTLSLNLKSIKTDHLWSLEFQVSKASGHEHHTSRSSITAIDQTFDAKYLITAQNVIEQVYVHSMKPQQLVESLEDAIHMKRKDWPISVIRNLADSVLRVGESRKKSSAYEERWWNILGFLMRPGYGYPLDDYRIKELWKIILSDFKSKSISLETQIQMWICWRRISGGLSKGQQIQIAMDLINSVLNKKGYLLEIKTKGEQYPYTEKIRTLGSLEMVDNSTKTRLGNALIARIAKGQASPVEFWAAGRIGARHLLYGSIVNVIPATVCEQWIDQLIASQIDHDEHLAFLFGQLARKTEHREINVSMKCIEKILKHFDDTDHASHLKEIMLNTTRLSQIEQERVLGDQLPSALTI